MVDIIGYITVDESKQEEIQELFDNIEKFRFMEKHSNFFLKVSNCSEELGVELKERLKGFKSHRVFRHNSDRYGDGILALMFELPHTKYFMEFESPYVTTDNYSKLLEWCEEIEKGTVGNLNGVCKREWLENTYKQERYKGVWNHS